MSQMPEIVVKESSLKKMSLTVMFCSLVVGCAVGSNAHKPSLSPGVLAEQARLNQTDQTQTSRDVVVEANPDQVDISSDIDLSQDPDLPLQDLDAETLEQLLIMNFASFQNDWSTAITSGTLAATKSQDFRVARMATMLALRNTNYDEASEAAKIWLTLKPQSINAQNMNILSLVGSQQTEAAKTAIALQIAEQDVESYIKQLAGLLVRQKNPESGFDIADYMVQKYPQSAQVLLSAAYVAQVFKKYEAAEVWSDEALSLKPGWDLAAQLIANLLNEQNKLDQRAVFINQFVKKYPHSVAMRINHAAELGRAKRYVDAYQLMLEVLSDAPNNVNALQYAAALAEQLDNNKKSKQHLSKALRVEPKNDDARWSLARMAVRDKKYVTAERLFDQIEDESLYVRAQIQVANIRNQTQGLERAVNTLRALRPRTEDDFLQVAITRHYLLMSARQYDEAFGYINETLVYLPDNLELLYARALVAAELQKIGVAEADLRRIIAQQPKHANALNALGYTLADQTNRYAEAKELILKALVLRPSDAHVLDSMGWVSYKLKDFATAIEFLKKAYAASPEAEVAAHLGEVLWESGEQDKARAVLLRSYAEDSDNPILNEVIERYGINLDSLAADAENAASDAAQVSPSTSPPAVSK
ncbi:MAG: tetratricopeptide (TPR) repeat protein [Chitinophagales bacterium]|jgi:tetratricopeptide (TPR) repeat protein